MTDEQKITKVLTCCGKAPRSGWAFDDAEKTAVAALCGDDGLLVAGGQEAFRLLMVEHYERRKATSDEFDSITIERAARVPLKKLKCERLEVGCDYDEAKTGDYSAVENLRIPPDWNEPPTPEDSE